MQNYKIALSGSLCLILSFHASASIVAWSPNVPSSLDLFQGQPAQLANLTGDSIFIYAHPRQNTQLPTLKTAQKAQFYSAAIVLNVPEARIKSTLQNFAGYVGLFPTLKSAQTIQQHDHIQQVKYQVHIPTPIPILNFKEHITMQHHIEENSISSLVIDAPIPYAAGRLEWFALSPQKTLVTITQWGDLNQPKGFLFSKILNALPEMKMGIPSGTNAFLLEALQQRFHPASNQILATGQLPSQKLNPTQLTQIASLSQKSLQPVSYVLPRTLSSYPNSRENLRFSNTYHYFSQSAEKLQPWLHAQSSQQLFPRQIKQIQLHAVEQQVQEVNYKIAVGLGVISIPFDFKMRFSHPSALHNHFDATGGDLRFVRGGMRLIPHSTGTLFQMTSSMKIHDQAPFLLKAMRSLPYHDLLPALGANTVYALKVQQKMRP